MRSRLRFIIAISLAVVLGAWLAWTSLGGTLETYAGPGEHLSVSGAEGWIACSVNASGSGMPVRTG